MFPLEFIKMGWINRIPLIHIHSIRNMDHGIPPLWKLFCFVFFPEQSHPLVMHGDVTAGIIGIHEKTDQNFTGGAGPGDHAGGHLGSTKLQGMTFLCKSI